MEKKMLTRLEALEQYVIPLALKSVQDDAGAILGDLERARGLGAAERTALLLDARSLLRGSFMMLDQFLAVATEPLAEGVDRAP